MAAAIAPALLLLWLVVAADSRPEPPRVVAICFGLAALSEIPVGLLELWLQALLPITGNAWLAPFETALLLAGIPEETVKVAIIAAMALRARDFDEPMDGVVYGTAVGLGFAAVENLFYVAGDTHWAVLAVTRGLLSVPFHGALGAIAGAYIARARFGGALGAHCTLHWRRQRLFALAWLVPVVLHSLFDGALFSLRDASAATAETTEGALRIVLMLLAAIVVGLGAIVVAVRLARRIPRRQKQWVQSKRLAPTHWRAIWARSLLGIGLSFVAVALLIAGTLSGRIAGGVLIVAAVLLSRHCAKYLSEAALSRHRAATAPASS